MSTEPYDPYELLGVPRSATDGDVRAAYFRLVRVHSPETDPVAFDRISRAYRDLRSPEARRRIDAAAPARTELGRAIERARRALHSRDLHAAVKGAAAVYTTYRPDPRALHAAAEVFAAAGALKSAARTLVELHRTAPQTEGCARLLGEIEMQRGRVENAERAFAAALQVDAADHTAHVGLIDARLALGRRDDAESALEAALRAAGDDVGLRLPLMVRRGRLLIERGHGEAVRDEMLAFLDEVPRDDEAARGAVARTLVGHAQSLDADATMRARVADVAAEALPDNSDVQRYAQSARDREAAEQEIARARNDRRVPEWLKMLATEALRAFDADESAELAHIAPAYARRDAVETRREWSAFAKRYPALAALTKPLREALRDAPELSSGRAGRSARRRTSSESGCGASFGYIIAFLLLSQLVRLLLRSL